MLHHEEDGNINYNKFIYTKSQIFTPRLVHNNAVLWQPASYAGKHHEIDSWKQLPTIPEPLITEIDDDGRSIRSDTQN
jgi:hypothetical protein